MGEIVEVSFENIRPAQAGYLPQMLKGVIEFSRHTKLFPPIVREQDGYYYELDGRHRLIYARLLNYDVVPLYVAEHREDIPILSENNPQELISDAAVLIDLRWEASIAKSKIMGHPSFDEWLNNLRSGHPELASIDEFVKACESRFKSQETE